MQAQIDELMKGAANVPMVSSDGGVDPSQLAKMFASKSEFDELKYRVEVLENGQSVHTKQIDELMSRVGDLTSSDSAQNEQIDNLWNNINHILANLNKDGPVVVQPPVQAKDNSGEVAKLQEQVFALKNELALKLNISDFETYKKEMKMNELDRIDKIIEELRQQGFIVQKNQEDLKKDFD